VKGCVPRRSTSTDVQKQRPIQHFTPHCLMPAMMDHLYKVLAWCFSFVLALGIFGYRWLQLRRSRRAIIWELIEETCECYDDVDAHEDTEPPFFYLEPRSEDSSQRIETETPVVDHPRDSELDLGQFLNLTPEREIGPHADPLLAPTTATTPPSAELSPPTTPAAGADASPAAAGDQTAQQPPPVFTCPERGCETTSFPSQGVLRQVSLPCLGIRIFTFPVPVPTDTSCDHQVSTTRANIASRTIVHAVGSLGNGRSSFAIVAPTQAIRPRVGRV
jgi:hypothetical protein